MASSGAHNAWTIDNWGNGYDLINDVSGFAPQGRLGTIALEPGPIDDRRHI
jgi:hypothetical protein